MRKKQRRGRGLTQAVWRFTTAMPFSVEAIAEVTRADDSSKVIGALLLAGRGRTHIYTWDKRGKGL